MSDTCVCRVKGCDVVHVARQGKQTCADGVRWVVVVFAGWVETGGVCVMPTGRCRRVGSGRVAGDDGDDGDDGDVVSFRTPDGGQLAAVGWMDGGRLCEEGERDGEGTRMGWR